MTKPPSPLPPRPPPSATSLSSSSDHVHRRHEPLFSAVSLSLFELPLSASMLCAAARHHCFHNNHQQHPIKEEVDVLNPTVEFNKFDSKSKRLMKKRTVPELAVDMVRDDGSVSGCGNRKKFFRDGGNSNKKFKRSGDAPEVKEMWDTIVGGGDSEEEKKGIQRELDDDYFIDDSGVNPVNRHGSNRCGYSSSRAPKAEEEGGEDDEIKELFKTGKKKKKTEKTAMEIAIVVEKIMAELEVAAEEDANLNRASKPAINKLIKLPFLIEALSKKQLQLEFLDHGVLTLLKNWLEPLPDGSLPNRNIRTAVLEILTEFPIDLYQDDRREQLKKSGIGKAVMFMSKSDEETASNRKLAKDLVDKWSRQIFHISNRFEDLKDERIPIRRPSIKMPINKSSRMQFRDDDDLDPAKYYP
ncbi:protein IWS1 homolog 1 [Helianthus annuus]|uniref:protein IWS1 homolog 1 n=1 Tax=Helianthus annuus TaxID=4232 RepID=UPI001652BDD7|nr:protein IWS1 homolog 1 [Helianthus annuus]